MRRMHAFMYVGIFALFVQAEVIQVHDKQMTAGTTTNWTKDNVYILNGLVFVDSGATLNIEAGTVIKGFQDEDASVGTALVVAAKGKIYAEGTADEPIIFTAFADDPKVNDEDFDIDNYQTGQLWGGVIIMGRATVNTPTGYFNMEGIDPDLEPRAVFGGGLNPDDNDNSGVFKYVSIRHAGYILGADNEINGLTMGGVGRGTTIEYVEVFLNSDDGFEWFGGTVNCRYLVSAFNADDGFDYDTGWRGRGQYWFYWARNVGDKGGEHDGGEVGAQPFSMPVISNVTYLGKGEKTALHFRENAGGKYFNSIFTKFHKGMDIADIDDPDSRQRWEAGDLLIKGSIFWDIGDPMSRNKPVYIFPGSANSITDRQWAADSLGLESWGNQIVPPGFTYWHPSVNLPVFIKPSNVAGLDLRPRDTSAAVLTAWNNLAVLADGSGYIEPTTFIGAFDPREKCWMRGWTALDALGYLSTNDEPTVTTPRPDPISIAANTTVARNGTMLHIARNGNSVTVGFELPARRTIKLELFDLTGKLSASLASGVKSAGFHTITIDKSLLSAGNYVCRLTADGRIISKPIALVR